MILTFLTFMYILIYKYRHYNDIRSISCKVTYVMYRKKTFLEKISQNLFM